MSTAKLLSPDQLDARSDAGKSLAPWLGRQVQLHFGNAGTLVRHKTRKFAVKFQFGPCKKCGEKSDYHYAVSGLHSGAWCYLYTAGGKYLACMRDAEYHCGCNMKEGVQ